jgi:hypothetical protein
MKGANQEPVAWMVYTQNGVSVYVTDNPVDIQDGQRALPLYAAPRQWVGLTDEEIKEIVHTYPRPMGPLNFARAVEQRLKEMNA